MDDRAKYGGRPHQTPARSEAETIYERARDTAGAPEGDPKQDEAEIRTSAIRGAGSLPPVERPLHGLNATHMRSGGRPEPARPPRAGSTRPTRPFLRSPGHWAQGREMMEPQVLWKRGTRGTVPSRTDGATGAPDTERIPPSKRGNRGSRPYLSMGYKRLYSEAGFETPINKQSASTSQTRLV